MVTDRVIGARDVGKTFAEAVQGDPAVVSIWARRHRAVFELWLLTDAVDPDHERRLYQAVGTLHEAFPHALIRVHFLNPEHIENGGRNHAQLTDPPENAELVYARQE